MQNEVFPNMTLPVLEYGDIFLVGTTEERRKKLQTLQNKGLRFALNKSIDTSTDELHAEANLLKLKLRREQHLLNYMFDVEVNVIKQKEAGMVTRSQKVWLLKVERPGTEKFRKKFNVSWA